MPALTVATFGADSPDKLRKLIERNGKPQFKV